jgi:hypothetical protein
VFGFEEETRLYLRVGVLGGRWRVEESETGELALVLSYGIRLKASIVGEQRPPKAITVFTPPPTTAHCAEGNTRIRYQALVPASRGDDDGRIPEVQVARLDSRSPGSSPCSSRPR